MQTIRYSLSILLHNLAIVQAPSCTSGTQQPGPQVGGWGWEKLLFWLQWWPGHPVSKASCSSKSIQQLPNIRIWLSAVQTAGAKTLRVSVASSGPALPWNVTAPGQLCPSCILWPLQRLSFLVFFNKFYFCSNPLISLSVICR